jgi:vacuolar-type H+-ATPase subunit F/Vma7
MSRLRVLARPELALGFELAGVETYSVDDSEAAHERIANWLDEDRDGLIAIDEGLLAQLDEALLRRLDSAQRLHYMAIPGGGALGPEFSRQHRISEMIRHAIGVRITFHGEGPEAVEDGEI